MKLIKPSVEIIPQESGLNGIYKMIELAGRTCYKSEDKITEDSAKAFVDRMIASGHGAMLEFGTVYLKIPLKSPGNDAKYYDNEYSEYYVDEHDNSYITTNMRVLVENDWLDDLQYLCEPTKYHEKRICAKFITDRGVSHELVRHRKFSFAQESTRYCNYSKDKFDNQLTFIVPNNMYEDDVKDKFDNDLNNNKILQRNCRPAWAEWLKVLGYGERCYLHFVDKGIYGISPQVARSLLPNALKTEINMCGFISDWKHFFELRDSPKAHPDMQVLAKDLHQQFIDNKLL